MIVDPPTWTLARLRDQNLGVTRIWSTPSISEKVQRELPWPIAPIGEPPGDLETLIVVGGGTLIDLAKFTIRSAGHPIRLVAIPSIWGSGAEVSPIVVLDENGRKLIHRDDKYVPDCRVIWPELADSIPPERAKNACGDCWAHALEGFVSPLASDELRSEMAELIGELCNMSFDRDPAWFELSARACQGQAKSSVGLVHGIAHVTEGVLTRAQPNTDWGHAQLCSIFLLPVMELNRLSSDRWKSFVSDYHLDETRIFQLLRSLFDMDVYKMALPSLLENWRAILADPCSRTNMILVRPKHREHFESCKFQ